MAMGVRQSVIIKHRHETGGRTTWWTEWIRAIDLRICQPALPRASRACSESVTVCVSGACVVCGESA